MFLAAWAAALRFFIVEAYGVQGWIVDLRGNQGGNTWAGMVALGPLLGEGSLGDFVDRGSRLTYDRQQWTNPRDHPAEHRWTTPRPR